MKLWKLLCYCSTFLLLSSCSLNDKPSYNEHKDTYKTVITTEEVLQHSAGNIILKKTTETTEMDKSVSTPVYSPKVEPTFFQKVRNFVLKYSLILGIIGFLCPSLVVLILKILYNRTRSALLHIKEGVEHFKEEQPDHSKSLLNHLSKSMDKKSKDIIKKL